MSDLQYRGSCHCGAVRFAFTSAPIVAAKRCNCSLCVRRGMLVSVSYLPLDELTGQEALTLYQWGDRDCNFYFCRTCGVHMFHDTVQAPGHYRINVGCVEGIDALALPYEILDGKSFPLRDG